MPEWHVSLDLHPYLWLRPVTVPKSLKIGIEFLGSFIVPFRETANQPELSSDILLLGIKKPQSIEISALVIIRINS